MNYQYARTYRGTVQLVVFDWAGTTVDFGCQAPVSAFVEGFRQQGVHVSSRAARIPMGMEKRDHIRALATQEEVNRSWREVHGRDVTENDIDTMYNAFASLLLESIEEQSNLIPGVLPAIEILRAQGIKIGASTGYFEKAAETYLTALSTNKELNIVSHEVAEKTAQETADYPLDSARLFLNQIRLILDKEEPDYIN